MDITFPSHIVEASAPQKTDTVRKETTVHTPRFLLIRKMEGDFSSDSPFLISKTLYGLIGETKNVKKINGQLLIETVSNAQSLRLLQIQRFFDFAVQVTPHSTLNNSRGVIYCRDLLNCTIDEILEGLKTEGVTAIKRIQVKKEGTLKDTPTHILTFNTPNLPTHIKVAFYKLPVRPYIPPPLRCFKCQLFGHTATRCTAEQVCVCGQPLHEGASCQTPITCINCGGEHSARSKSCPKYKTEMAIQKVKVTDKISYAEAKRKVVIPTPIIGVSYAQATQSTQSRITNIQDIISQLTPMITDTIKIALERNLDAMGMSQNIFRSRSASMSSSVTSERRSKPASSLAAKEKRKRSPSRPTTSSFDGGIEDNILIPPSQDRSNPPKKKPGRPPKGKPRENSGSSQ